MTTLQRMNESIARYKELIENKKQDIDYDILKAIKEYYDKKLIIENEKCHKIVIGPDRNYQQSEEFYDTVYSTSKRLAKQNPNKKIIVEIFTDG